MENELNLKYNQVCILILAGDTNVCIPAFYLTEKPSFDEIDTKLYQSINKTLICTEHSIGDRFSFTEPLGQFREPRDMWVDTCDSLPFIHRNAEPTMKEVLDYIPYHPEYQTVYIFYIPKNYMIGDYYVSKLLYSIQMGFWIPKPEKPEWKTGKALEPKVEKKCVMLPLPKISNEEMHKRYDQVTPIYIKSSIPHEDNESVYIMKKTEFSQMNSTAYLWQTPDDTSIIGKYHLDSKNILTNEGQLCAQFVCTIPTFHEWAYYGFFKPSFDEVLVSLPSNVTNINDKYFVTTKIPHPEINHMCMGNFHIGATTIWKVINYTDHNVAVQPVQPVQPVQSVKQRDDYNEELCMICLENQPSTMVMPCCHVVVCDKCSRDLPKTGDANICVKCRQPITEVIYP